MVAEVWEPFDLSMHYRIPLLTRWFERRGRRRLRSIMRGYRGLRASDDLLKLTRVMDALTNTRLPGGKAWPSALVFGAGLKDAELIVRQYLLVRVGGYGLNLSLLHALGRKGSVVHPLPPEWRTALESQGFKVAGLRSALAWNSFVALLLAFGFFSVIKRIVGNLLAVVRARSSSLGRHVYFDSLGTGNLPQPGTTGRSHNIVDWYQQWPGRTTDLDAICHGVVGAASGWYEGVPVIPLASAIMPLGRLPACCAYAGWGVGASTLAVVDFLCGRWWHALLLHEAAKSAQVRLQDPDRLARDYLFHNSVYIYRPLWTYEARQKGARVVFYFYSSNCESFKRLEGYPRQANSWQVMNWPLYLVWDETQADFVRRAVGEGAAIRIVGPIWFHGVEAVKLPPLSRPGVAVFDITPVRESIYAMLAPDMEYYVPGVCSQFLGDSQRVTAAQGFVMLWKRKRKLNDRSRVHPRYRSFTSTLVELDNVRAIDSDISAYVVIGASAAVISMPFTSTAVIARELGRPSCYYDPTGLVQKDDRAAHGIEIISGREELARWLGSVARAAGQTTPGSGLKDRPKAAGLAG